MSGDGGGTKAGNNKKKTIYEYMYLVLMVHKKIFVNTGQHDMIITAFHGLLTGRY